MAKKNLPQLPKIEGTVDPRAVEKARSALALQAARGAIKSKARDEEGARQAAEALRRLMRG